MILPSKHLSERRALISVGSLILAELESPRSVSELWEKVRAGRNDDDDRSAISFDWFTLAVTFLFAIQAVELQEDGQLCVLPSDLRVKV